MCAADRMALAEGVVHGARSAAQTAAGASDATARDAADHEAALVTAPAGLFVPPPSSSRVDAATESLLRRIVDREALVRTVMALSLLRSVEGETRHVATALAGVVRSIRTDGEPVCGFLSGVIPLARYRHWILDTAAKLGSPLEP